MTLSSEAMRIAVASLAALLVLAAPAQAAPRMTPVTRAAIGSVVDRFVKDAVRRENLAAAWTIAGPDLRGGTTRRA